MWPAFPTSDYYETSATSLMHQVTLTLPALPPQSMGTWVTLPTFTMFRW